MLTSFVGSRPARHWAADSAGLAVLASFLFLRPNLFGEALAPFGAALLGLAVLFVLFRRDVTLDSGGATRAATAVVVCVALAYTWLILKSAVSDTPVLVRAAMQDFVITCGGLAALALVCRVPRSRLLVGRGVVLILALFCASYAVTLAVWLLAGFGSAQIAVAPIPGLDPLPVYFPFTATNGYQIVFGLEIPRFTGVGREPGWMAMYCAAGYFLVDLVGLRRARICKALFLVGLLGAVSTAGFGVFVVVWTYNVFLRARSGISLANYGRQLLGLGAMGGALWLATNAPVVGLSAKSTQNAVSLDRRQEATDAGVRALFDWPWGGPQVEEQGGVNLISDIAVNGLPFVVLCAAALLLPMAFLRVRGQGNAVPLVVFLTMLFSQPAGASTWAFGIVLVAYALADTGTGHPARHPAADLSVPVPDSAHPDRPPSTRPGTAQIVRRDSSTGTSSPRRTQGVDRR